MNASIQPSTIESALPIQRDFQVGDVARIRGTKDLGRVTEESCVSYAVCVFGGTDYDEQFTSALLEMWTPAPRRQFKYGDVRVVGTRFKGRVAFLFEDNGNEEEDMPYRVALYGDETEENFSASELIPWSPLVGERVFELHSDGGEVGIILANDGTTSHVRWDSAVSGRQVHRSDQRCIDRRYH
jgi:hypothetical protein